MPSLIATFYTVEVLMIYSFALEDLNAKKTKFQMEIVLTVSVEGSGSPHRL